jgi:hypothetical protein
VKNARKIKQHHFLLLNQVRLNLKAFQMPKSKSLYLLQSNNESIPEQRLYAALHRESQTPGIRFGYFEPQSEQGRCERRRKGCAGIDKSCSCGILFRQYT